MIRVPVRSGWVAQRGSLTRPSRVVGLGWVGRVLGGVWGQNLGLGFYVKPLPSQNFIGLKLRLEQYFFLSIRDKPIDKTISLSITLNVNPTSGWVKMGWVGLGPRIFDLPNVGLGTYFREPNLPNNPLGQGNPSGQPYRTGTLLVLLL